MGEGEEGYAILRHFSSRGLGTPEIKTASVPVPAFTGNKMASRKLQIREEEEQLLDRPEPAQIAKEWDQKKCPYYRRSLLSGLILTENVCSGTKKTVRNQECPYQGDVRKERFHYTL